MNKEQLRSQFKHMRMAIDPTRREEASQALLLHLLPSLVDADYILSFVSIHHEIDTSLINLYLARTKRLLLPKMQANDLVVYQVSNPSCHLQPNSFGLLEPNPDLCPPIDPSLIQIVLVPALAFDKRNHRLGYGRGFYDRFLKTIPQAQTIGIGFKEQLIPSIPTHESDISLEKVSLF